MLSNQRNNVVIVMGIYITSFTILCCQEENSVKSVLRNAQVGFTSSAAGMLVYTPFHYFQNRIIQNLPIIWNNPTYWFRGAPSLILGKGPTMAVELASYQLIAKVLQQQGATSSSVHNTIAATLAGAAGGVVNNLTHLIALHQENKGCSFAQTIREFPNKRVWMRGLGTTITREMIFSNIFFVTLKKLRAIISAHTESPRVAQVTSGLIAGALVAGVTQPFMVVTAHLYADVEKKQYTNGLDAVRKIFRAHGLRHFYKGSAYRSVGIMLALPVFDAVRSYYTAKK